MKRLKLFALQIAVYLFLSLSGSSCADSVQFPDIDRMEIPKLELDI